MFRYLIVLLSIFLLSIPAYAAVNQNDYDKKMYELEKLKLLNAQKRHEEKLALEEKLFREKMQMEEKRYNEAKEEEYQKKRKQVLLDVKTRCESENQNKVSFDERTLCSAVSGHFKYGTAIPDAMLGISR